MFKFSKHIVKSDTPENRLEVLFKVWCNKKAQTELNPGATADQISSVEQKHKISLPDDFKWIYQKTNGGHLFGGNVILNPLTGNELSVEQNNDFLILHGWKINKEMVVFGSNGGGDLIAFWTHPETKKPCIVEIGAIFEEGSFSIVGTSLTNYLFGRCAYYSVICECPNSIIKQFQIPRKFLNDEFDDDIGYDRLIRYYDPTLPPFSLDPYKARLTNQQINEFVESMDRRIEIIEPRRGGL